MDLIPAAGAALPPLAVGAIVLFLLAIVPLLGRRAGLPDCVGCIAVGVLVGPHLLGLVPCDEALSGAVADLGKLLLMFFVGLEIDLAQFRAQGRRAVAFGALTFALPMLAGTAVGLAFGYPLVAAILMGSLLASHTLIAYPAVKAAALQARPAVTITVGNTMLTDMASLLVLAACLSAFQTGFSPTRLAVEIAALVGFAAVVVLGLGAVGRVALARLTGLDEAQFLVLLGLVCVAAAGAELLDLEDIIGAFLAGLAVNSVARRLIAREQLEFVGRALLIPAFFVVTGFLVDLDALGGTLVAGTPLVLAIVGGLIASKLLAASLAGRGFGLAPADRALMGSLTLPQVAATLAATLVGYAAVNADGERLLDIHVFNAVLVLVVATAVLGPILTDRAIRRLRP